MSLTCKILPLYFTATLAFAHSGNCHNALVTANQTTTRFFNVAASLC